MCLSKQLMKLFLSRSCGVVWLMYHDLHLEHEGYVNNHICSMTYSFVLSQQRSTHSKVSKVFTETTLSYQEVFFTLFTEPLE
jgi:hypothetical protein